MPDSLRDLIVAARTRAKAVEFTGYIGGYCDNLECDVRQVLIRVKYHDRGIGTIFCPACRRRMLIGEHDMMGATVITTDEYEERKDKDALRTVRSLLLHEQARARGERWLVRDLADLMKPTTLDDLAKAFRERDTFFAKSGSSPTEAAR